MFRVWVAISAVLMSVQLYAANPIEIENRNRGTASWRLSRAAASGGEIEGYASATSVNAGEAIRFYVSTIDPRYTIEIFRTGWYDGLGARRMTDATQRIGRQQSTPLPDPVTGLIECRWTDPYMLTIPLDWVSGVYLAKLTAQPGGSQNYILFVVREDTRPSAFLFQAAVTTTEAYNSWGGKSLYGFNSTGAAATKVSFDRPYNVFSGPNEYLLRYEYLMVRFLEREGYDVSYQTDVDTHERAQSLLLHRALLSVGHDEYWSWEMRRNVEGARDAGVSLGFFGGNACYWQIRLESGQGQPDRTIVAYKERALSADPIVNDGDPSNDYLVTTRWRDVPLNRPEEQLIGVMTSIVGIDADIVIENASHWVFTGTGLVAGDRLKGLEGHEADKMFGAYPPQTVRLAHTLLKSTDGQSDYGDMTIYQAASGAYVFAAGTLRWAWGLDSYADSAHGPLVNPAAQQITRNVLNSLISGRPVQVRRRRAHS